jgi:hypothetical protein
MYDVTCRNEILKCFRTVRRTTGREVLTPREVIEWMRREGTKYEDSTIRTHIVSRMCANAQQHHAVKYDDLIRIGRGQYQMVGQ